MKTKKFKVTTHDGDSIEIEGYNEIQIKGKIKTNHYGVLPLRGKEQIKITCEMIKEIVEIS